MEYSRLENRWLNDRREDYQYIPTYYSYRAVIVEPRTHVALNKVIENVCDKLGCRVTIVHGTKNKGFVEKIAERNRCVDRILEVNAAQLNGKTYSKLLMTEDFWDKIRNGESRILIFQTDSGICGPGKDILDFLGYDYCGAPWKSMKVGNGGLSIRNPELAKKHIRENKWKGENEDVKFAQWCREDANCNICEAKEGVKFASEHINNVNSWGFHQNWNRNNYEAICEFNKEIEKMNDVNSYPQNKSKYKIPDKNWKPKIKM